MTNVLPMFRPSLTPSQEALLDGWAALQCRFEAFLDASPRSSRAIIDAYDRLTAFNALHGADLDAIMQLFEPYQAAARAHWTGVADNIDAGPLLPSPTHSRPN